MKPSLKNILFIMLAGAVIFASAGITAGKDKAGSSKKKKMYIANIKGEGINKQLIDRIRNGITLSVLDNYGNLYQVLDDEAVRIMYRQAEKIMSSGCDDTSCITQIADGINADEIIYGEVSLDAGMVKLVMKCLARKNMELGTKSMVNISFKESQADWFAMETAKKLVEPSYRIDASKAPAEFDSKVDIRGIAIGGVESFDIKVLNFTSSDESIQNIIGYLKDLLKFGDKLFSEKEYKDAIDKYKTVIKKIDEDLLPKSRGKVQNFKKETVKRIDASFAMIYKSDMEKVDLKLKNEDAADESFIKKIIRKYNDIKEEMKKEVLPQAYGDNVKKIEAALKDRMEACYTSICTLHEKTGDTAYNEYRFDTALEEYNKSLAACKNITGRKKSELETRYNTKIKTTQKTGTSYLQNRIASYISIIEFYNIKGEKSDAKSTLKDARKYLTGGMSKFATLSVIDEYNLAAQLLKQDEITESSNPDTFKMLIGTDKIINKYRNQFSFKKRSCRIGWEKYYIDDNTMSIKSHAKANKTVENRLRKKTALTAALLENIFIFGKHFQNAKIEEIDKKLSKEMYNINYNGVRIEGYEIYENKYEIIDFQVKLTFTDNSTIAIKNYELTNESIPNIDKLYNNLSLLSIDSFFDIYDVEDGCEVCVIYYERRLKLKICDIKK